MINVNGKVQTTTKYAVTGAPKTMPSSNSEELSRVVRRKSNVFKLRSEAMTWLQEERHQRHTTSACVETKTLYSARRISRATGGEPASFPGWSYIRTTSAHRI